MNDNIQEDYCSFEVSKLLKEKGFKKFTDFCYIAEGHYKVEMDDDKVIHYNGTTYKEIVPIPTHSLACKWIRENFGIHIYPQFQTWNDGCWTGNWCLKQDILWTFHDVGILEDGLWKRTSFNSPEKATEAALKYVLSNLI